MAAALLVSAGCAHAPPPANEFLTGITHEGYTPNRGLSGLFQPGNVIQTMEMGDDGQPRKLSPPLILAWASDCFPGVEPRESPFIVEQSSSEKSRSFALEGPDAAALVPGLSFDASGVRGHRLALENARVRAYAKADVSGKMSQTCIDAIADAVRAGDRPEWFTLVLEAVVVDSLRLEIAWQSDVSLEARERITQRAAQFMSSLGNQIGGQMGMGAQAGAGGQQMGMGGQIGQAVGQIGGVGQMGGDGWSPVSPDLNQQTTYVGPDGTTVVNPNATTVVGPVGTTVVNPDGTTVINPDGTTTMVNNPGAAQPGGPARGAKAKIGSSSKTGTTIELGAAAVVAYRTRRLERYAPGAAPIPAQ